MIKRAKLKRFVYGSKSCEDVDGDQMGAFQPILERVIHKVRKAGGCLPHDPVS